MRSLTLPCWPLPPIQYLLASLLGVWMMKAPSDGSYTAWRVGGVGWGVVWGGGGGRNAHR
jgi:hypothetical protein